MSEPIIEINDVYFSYFGKEVLEGISFEVPAGCVCGLIGENGVGKTTLIKHLLGRLVPHEGSVRVFGADPASDPEGVLSRIGYLSEDRDLPNWMSVKEFIYYIRAFYPNWDDDFAEELREMFGLDGDAKISELSRGQRARMGLLAAVAHRPPLLVLDEPSSGLDAVVRRDILNAVIRVVADEGRTVLFSSHLLHELQQVSDRVVMLNGGNVILQGPVDEILSSNVRMVATIENDDYWRNQIGSVHARQSGNDWEVIVDKQIADRITEIALRSDGKVIQQSTPTLDELFVALSAGT